MYSTCGSICAQRRATGLVDTSVKSYCSRFVKRTSTNGCSSAGKRGRRMGPGHDEVDVGERVVDVALAAPDEERHVVEPEVSARRDPIDVCDVHGRVPFLRSLALRCPMAWAGHISRCSAMSILAFETSRTIPDPTSTPSEIENIAKPVETNDSIPFSLLGGCLADADEAQRSRYQQPQRREHRDGRRRATREQLDRSGERDDDECTDESRELRRQQLAADPLRCLHQEQDNDEPGEGPFGRAREQRVADGGEHDSREWRPPPQLARRTRSR